MTEDEWCELISQRTGAPIEKVRRVRQIAKLQASFTAAGITDRAERLAKVASLVGREVSSANDLTRAEANAVIDWLAAESETPAPAEAS